SWERFADRYTADLANAFGNLASRTVAMVEKYRGGAVPAVPPVVLGATGARTRPTSRRTTPRWTARAATCPTRRLRRSGA
ncbi:MAG TPA: hypothetical protein VGD56_07700, partial [Gemmatirosa sp.]